MNEFEENVLSVMTKLPVVVYRCIQKGLDRKFQFISPNIREIVGMTVEELLGDSRAFFRLIHSDDRNEFLKVWSDQKSFPATVSLEYRVKLEDRRVIYLEEHCWLLQEQGNNVEMVCHGILFENRHLQNITDELHRWDRELQSVTSNLPDIIGRVNSSNRLLYLNRCWDGGDSLPPERYLGKRLSDLGLPSKIVELLEEKIKFVFLHETLESIEISYPDSQGVRIFDVRFCPERDANRPISTVLFVWRDITDVRMADMAFRESDEKFRQLAEAIDSVFWIWDIEMQGIVYVSPAYERLWGGNAQQLLKNPFDWLAMVLPEDRNRVENLFLKRLGGKNLDIEYRIKGSNEEIRWVHNRTYPLIEGCGTVSRIIGLAQDVTERKKWEEEHVRGAKLESLGLLAGGLAHDFNNLLTAILGQLSLAKYEVDPGHPLLLRLAEAEQASMRAQDIAGQLLTFSKGGDPVKSIVSLENILEENVQLVLAGSNVRPVIKISPGLGSVNVDLGQICQVLHNLVINARQAMESGGECLVEAYNTTREESERICHSHQLVSMYDQWILISVQDQGIGIPKENVAKVFDPYFTTKSAGSGLGLATSYSIIRNHGGVLWVESDVGVGSRFSFLLPAVSPEKTFPTVTKNEMKFGYGNILIMDDEIQIRKVLGEMLETCGYNFQAVPDGEQALKVFHQAHDSGEPFSAVILDLTIPGGVGGKEVVKEMLSLDPGLRAIVVSGYSNDPVLANYKDYGFKGRVAKPFNLIDLSLALSSVLKK